MVIVWRLRQNAAALDFYKFRNGNIVTILSKYLKKPVARVGHLFKYLVQFYKLGFRYFACKNGVLLMNQETRKNLAKAFRSPDGNVVANERIHATPS